ncbi:cytochrome P450 [Panus rudis PR-1116 ss-1]|nr:cytochrome P450 [Panus rudis PR-1116 ss-1]
MFWLTFAALACIVLVSQFVRSRLRRLAGKLPFPPGPKGYPIIGNLLDLPTVEPSKTYREWSNIYGDVVYLDLPFRPTAVLGSVKAARDLLEKRSDIYSDRYSGVTIDLCGWGFNIALMGYSQRWRAHRRALHQYVNERAQRQWNSIQLDESRMFIRRLLDEPENLNAYIPLMSAAIILRIVYGMRINSTDDEYIRIVREAVRGFSVAVVPGNFWVDYIPIMRYLPEWFPGTGFKRFAKEIREYVDVMKYKPFEDVVERMEMNTAEPCLTSAFIAKTREQCQTPEEWAAQEEIIVNVAGIAYAAGADTTVAAVRYFFAAMSLYPNVQKAAQKELNDVVGPHRLPTFDDFDKLIYIRAVVLESLRWQVVAPFGMPHRSIRDDVYNGYFIPAGTEIIPNAWAMLHDPEEYPDPYEFKPERFIKVGKLDPNVRDPTTIAFGFGRRICPGRHLANATLFIVIASTLHTFNIEPKDGERFDPNTMIETGVISGPTKLPCIVKSRSKDAEHLVRGAFAAPQEE